MPVGCGGGGKEVEFATNRYKLLYTEWINNTVLLYSIGNYIQYPVINHSRKEYEKGIYIYIKLNYFAGHQKVTEYCKTTIRQ